MRKVAVGLSLSVALMSAPAVAADRNGTRAIVSGDYTTAEQTLLAERRIFPRRPELMLNLAAVYRQTGRDAEARALYAEVLQRDDVLMDMLDQRTNSSHAIAQTGLTRLTQLAAR
jgi:UTP:GlnB (protein PII) uridylyltransferase